MKIVVNTRKYDIHRRYVAHLFYAFNKQGIEHTLLKGRYLNQELVNKGSLLLLCAVIASMAVGVLVQFEPTQLGLDNTTLAALGGQVASFAFVFVLVFILYALVPYTRVPRRKLLPGAVVAALLFELGEALFVLYLDYAASLKAVYGSLSSVIVLLLWLYFTARVLLFGAEVIAVRKEA